MPNTKDPFSAIFGEVNGHSDEDCPKCGGGLVETSIKDSIELPDGAVVSARVPLLSCDKCEFSFKDERSEEIRDASVRLHLGLLTPVEIKAIRDGLNLSRRQFSEAFGITPASMERWENGRLMQSKSADTLLRALQIPRVACEVDRRGRNFGNRSSFPENVIELRALRDKPEIAAEAKVRADHFMLRRM